MADPTNIGGIVINNLSKEENVQRKQNPVKAKIFAAIQCLVLTPKSNNSEINLLLYIMMLACYVSRHMSEYVQTKHSTVDYHTYSSGT
jgi:hypothetical protein